RQPQRLCRAKTNGKILRLCTSRREYCDKRQFSWLGARSHWLPFFQRPLLRHRWPADVMSGPLSAAPAVGTPCHRPTKGTATIQSSKTAICANRGGRSEKGAKIRQSPSVCSIVP